MLDSWCNLLLSHKDNSCLSITELWWMRTLIKLRDFSARRLLQKPPNKEVKDKWSKLLVMKVATKLTTLSLMMKFMSLKTISRFNVSYIIWIEISWPKWETVWNIESIPSCKCFTSWTTHPSLEISWSLYSTLKRKKFTSTHQCHQRTLWQSYRQNHLQGLLSRGLRLKTAQACQFLTKFKIKG